MRIGECPHCQEHSLVPTGGYWTCGGCDFAITSAALMVDHAGSAGGQLHESGAIVRSHHAS